MTKQKKLALNIKTSSSILIEGGSLNQRETLASQILNQVGVAEIKPTIDFLILDSSSIGIDEVRNATKFLSLSPSQKSKIVLILEAQRLGVEAQNAFLKTLEEPPSYAVIILTAPEKRQLLPTLVSRCQVVRVSERPDTESPKRRETKLCREILAADPAQRLVIAEKIDEPEKLITMQFDFFRKNLLRNVREGERERAKTALITLKTLTDFERLLPTNVNKRLLIDIILLSLPKIPF